MIDFGYLPYWRSHSRTLEPIIANITLGKKTFNKRHTEKPCHNTSLNKINAGRTFILLVILYSELGQVYSILHTIYIEETAQTARPLMGQHSAVLFQGYTRLLFATSSGFFTALVSATLQVMLHHLYLIHHLSL